MGSYGLEAVGRNFMPMVISIRRLKMRVKGYLLVPLVIISVLNINLCGTLAQEKEEKNVVDVFQHFTQSMKHERSKILSEVKENKIQVSDKTKKTLIDAFEKESLSREAHVGMLKKQGIAENIARQKAYSDLGGKEYVRYYGDFATLISSFKDIRTIPSLLRGLNDYGGTVVPTHIITIGEDAVAPLINTLSSNDRVLRNMSFFVLSVWVNAPVVSEDYTVDESMSIKNINQLERIKKSFLGALKDKDVDVRSRAIYGLAAFPDDAVINDLESVAKSDPYYSEYEKRYPLREEADKSIEKIKTKIKNKIP